MKPFILSVSRREDIPAFKSDWFIEKFKSGSIELTNPYSKSPYKVDFDEVKFIVFWTKNPKNIIDKLDQLPCDYYFQFTLNCYPEYELGVPPLEERIETFINLSEKIGKKKVIWRFDPILIDKIVRENILLKRIEYIGNKIYPYTDKLVFSYIDPYHKLKGTFNEVEDETKIRIAKQLIEFNKKWNLRLATCAEKIDLEGIEHNKCIDPNLIEEICGPQEWNKDVKDKGQRLLCGCSKSVDIGVSKSCKHRCLYCYAQ